MIKFNKIKTKIYNKKKIIVTGHTGFKGTWLTLWLNLCGASVLGISKNVPTYPSHYKKININKNIKEVFFNLKDANKTKAVFKKFKPDFVFHLAAQAIVKESYHNPLDTWQSNLNGTLSVLEALRNLKKKCVAVIITSDKVYKNIETEKGYKEVDLIGGDDPYSGSKGATELLINSYIKSYFDKTKSKISISIARAGNVIGGGDWSEGRLIPDCIKKWVKNKKVLIRHPNSTRPWQHVLEVIWGYLLLAEKLSKNKSKLHGEAFNFGPNKYSRYTVLQILNLIKKKWININWKIHKELNFKEAKLLKLNSKKAKFFLNWECVLTTNQTISMVLNWYNNYYFEKKNVEQFSIKQIHNYIRALKIK